MKKSIGIIFLSVLLLQVAGSYVYFIVRLSDIRHEMRELLKQMPDDQLTLLTLTREEFNKSESDDHEISVNGKMYDIARVIEKDEMVLIYALHDEAEDNLLAFLNEMVERSSNDKKPVPTNLIQLLTLQFIPVENKIPALAATTIKHKTPYHLFIPAFISVIDSPPPRG